MTIPFTKIERPVSLSQEIVSKIERSILARTLVAGQKLPTEQELCGMFSVSRTVVREAIHMLSAKGLVNVRKRSGIFVNDLSSHDAAAGVGMYLALNFDRDYILYVFNVRQAVEPQVCRWAAANRATANIWEMEKNLLKMGDCLPEDRETEHVLDQEFHQMIAAATKNPVVPLMMQPVYELMPRIRALVFAHAPTTVSSAPEYHRRILNAIRQRDEDAAYREMQMHISLAAQQANQVIDALDAAQAATAAEADGPPSEPARPLAPRASRS
jgi:GntR family transcriptional regulator, transcriptional repressor for pyruvate dehydrogenase complex